MLEPAWNLFTGNLSPSPGGSHFQLREFGQINSESAQWVDLSTKIHPRPVLLLSLPSLTQLGGR